MKSVIFRTDANQRIGMGHIMRCLSIADAFRVFDYKVLFVVADNGIVPYIQERGYDSICLYSDFTSMEEEISFWPILQSEYILVDSYYVTSVYLQRLARYGRKIIYIDDLYSFSYPVDILVNYGINANVYVYQSLYRHSKVKEPTYIIGPKYAPLRTLFLGIGKKLQPKSVSDILISTGGADGLHLTLAMIHQLLKQNNEKYTYHFLIGRMNTDKEQIITLIGDNNRFVLHENISDMKSLIVSCDLIISAAGSTLYEICACGVPFITFAIADNQIPAAESFGKMGLGVYVGDLRNQSTINPSGTISGELKENAVDLVLSACDDLAKDFERRNEMGKRMQDLIDGCGAGRIVQKITRRE